MIVTIMAMIGGIIIAMRSSLLTGVSGAGMMAGGIRPGVTIRTIPTTITMAPSMATTDFAPTK